MEYTPQFQQFIGELESWYENANDTKKLELSILLGQFLDLFENDFDPSEQGIEPIDEIE